MHPSALVLVALMLAPAVAPCQATRADVPAQVPIFREVWLGRDTLALGGPLGRLARYARSPQDTDVTIPRREFDGADEIEILRLPNGAVRRMTFLYGETRDVRSLLEDYRTSLGVPSDSSVQDTGRGRWQIWTWRDPLTEFEFVIIDPPFEAMRGLAILQERGLPPFRP